MHEGVRPHNMPVCRRVWSRHQLGECYFTNAPVRGEGDGDNKYREVGDHTWWTT